MSAFTIDVIGIPASQGSLVSNGHGRGLRYPNEVTLKAWRHMIIVQVQAAKPKGWQPTAPISITATFRFPRPANHYGTGRNRGQLTPSAPDWKTTKPDLDKTLRAVGDSLEQAGLILGDQQIVGINAAKRFTTNDEAPGLLLTVISHDTTSL
jgi:Holliday junction resolvase RusA-like endonuclease